MRHSTWMKVVGLAAFVAMALCGYADLSTLAGTPAPPPDSDRPYYLGFSQNSLEVWDVLSSRKLYSVKVAVACSGDCAPCGAQWHGDGRWGSVCVAGGGGDKRRGHLIDLATGTSVFQYGGDDLLVGAPGGWFHVRRSGDRFEVATYTPGAPPSGTPRTVVPLAPGAKVFAQEGWPEILLLEGRTLSTWNWNQQNWEARWTLPEDYAKVEPAIIPFADGQHYYLDENVLDPDIMQAMLLSGASEFIQPLYDVSSAYLLTAGGTVSPIAHLPYVFVPFSPDCLWSRPRQEFLLYPVSGAAPRTQKAKGQTADHLYFPTAQSVQLLGKRALIGLIGHKKGRLSTKVVAATYFLDGDSAELTEVRFPGGEMWAPASIRWGRPPCLRRSAD